MNYNTKESIKEFARSLTDVARFEVGNPGDEKTPKKIAWLKLALNAELLHRRLDMDETIEQ